MSGRNLEITLKLLGPELMFPKRDKHYPSRSGQISLAAAIPKFTKPVTKNYFGPSKALYHIGRCRHPKYSDSLRFRQLLALVDGDGAASHYADGLLVAFDLLGEHLYRHILVRARTRPGLTLGGGASRDVKTREEGEEHVCPHLPDLGYRLEKDKRIFLQLNPTPDKTLDMKEYLPEEKCCIGLGG